MEIRPNLIRRQVIQLDLVGTEADGIDVHSQLTALCHRFITPALDQALMRHASVDSWVTIERLDLDLGSMALSQLETALPPAIGTAVETWLADKLAIHAVGVTDTASNVVRRDHRQIADDALAAFLETGRLPWWFRIPPGQHLEAALLDTESSNPTWPQSISTTTAIVDVLASDTARRRLANQFSIDFQITLLRRLSPEHVSTVQLCIRMVGSAPSRARTELVTQLWHTATLDVVSGQHSTPQQLLAAALQYVPQDSDGYIELVRHLGAPTASPMSVTAALAVGPKTQDAGAPDRADDLMEGIQLDHAGIVLLHPFLTQCFTTLEYYAGDVLHQADRALAALHFLCTGRSPAPEYDLVLAKVLCGVPLELPVSMVALTASEMTECNALLDAVIQHWTALRDTGHDGLRGAFLVRPGLLSLGADGDWLLQVETDSVDILLDELPWGASMIQLPWMQRLLRVEWR